MASAKVIIAYNYHANFLADNRYLMTTLENDTAHESVPNDINTSQLLCK